MNRQTLALGLLIALAFAAPARAADTVVVAPGSSSTTTTTTAPAGGATVVKRTETTVPSADAAATSVKRAARRTSAAVERTAHRAGEKLDRATRPRTRVEKTTTTVDSGSGRPVVVTKEKKTTH